MYRVILLSDEWAGYKLILVCKFFNGLISNDKTNLKLLNLYVFLKTRFEGA